MTGLYVLVEFGTVRPPTSEIRPAEETPEKQAGK